MFRCSSSMSKIYLIESLFQTCIRGDTLEKLSVDDQVFAISQFRIGSQKYSIIGHISLSKHLSQGSTFYRSKREKCIHSRAMETNRICREIYSNPRTPTTFGTCLTVHSSNFCTESLNGVHIKRFPSSSECKIYCFFSKLKKTRRSP